MYIYCHFIPDFSFIDSLYFFQDQWVGGYKNKDGSTVGAFEGLQDKLSEGFELVEAQDMSFVIRETARKHQWTVAHATVWRRKAR